jgi:beta-1,2-mannobiose phosphorylase / 1,2-beta-oligomannan phosphorylase
MRKFSWIFILAIDIGACTQKGAQSAKDAAEFPTELVHFVPYSRNPLFSGTDTNTWDRHIRERGWILKEDSLYHLWYTGYIIEDGEKHLGYASSIDGIHWVRKPDNPIFSAGWVEDMCVVKSDSVYYMFAEGRGDTAHMLSSTDRIHWVESGNLDIRQTNGKPLKPGPFGTPTVIRENGSWYLFYERNDLGIWLAKSTDLKTWTNIQDNPVIEMGPEEYDRFAVAMDQVIKYKGLYYGYYHASAFKDWHEWSSDVAVSTDLVHWRKYPGNPILRENKSSAILVNDGKGFRLYSMHDKVQLHLPVTNSRRD